VRGVGFRRLNPHESQEIYLRAVRADWLTGRAEAIRRSLLLFLLHAPLTNGACFTRNGAIIGVGLSSCNVMPINCGDCAAEVHKPLSH